MEHPILESTLTPMERKFLDLMRHGDNFLKIELLRPAKSYYLKALELNLETEKVQQKISECNQLLAFEIKVIKILVLIGAGIVLATLLF
jgi:hypothetical protein